MCLEISASFQAFQTLIVKFQFLQSKSLKFLYFCETEIMTFVTQGRERGAMQQSHYPNIWWKFPKQL